MIFPSILVAITTLIVLIPPGYSGIVQPSNLITVVTITPKIDSTCQQNATQGIYSRFHQGWLDPVKCCKGKFLMDSFWIPKIKKGEAAYIPNWLSCAPNVTRDNDNDDLPTLMWKIHACKVKSVLGKEEGDIDYATYVEMRLSNYTKEQNVRKLIKEGNKECPEAENETEFHKKIAEYFMCFEKNSKKVCQETTPESEKELQIYLKQVEKSYNSTQANTTCPGVVEGIIPHQQCCKGQVIPHPWVTWLSVSAKLPNRIQQLPNGTLVLNKPYNKCMMTSYNARFNITLSTIQTAKTIKTDVQKKLYNACHSACSLHPVNFLDDGTSEPEMKFDFNQTLDKFLSNFNKPVKDTVFGAFKKLKPRLIWKPNNGKDKTEIEFGDVGSAYSKMTSLADKAKLYCVYHRTLVSIGRPALNECCR